jgi:hypothetical protein
MPCGRRLLVTLIVIAGSLTPAAARADHFDDHTAELIMKVGGDRRAKSATALSTRDLGALPRPIAGWSADAMLVVRTGDSRWAKLLVRPAQKKGVDGKPPTDLILIERVVTFGGPSRVMADRREIHVHAGTELDVDLGQVVPAGRGGDLVIAEKNGMVTVTPAEGVLVWSLSEPLTPPTTPLTAIRPGPVKGEDFVGAWTLDADGKTRGTLVLKVDAAGEISGEFRSEQSGSSYPVSGKVGNPAHKVTFKITFPMTEQEFEGHLFTRGKKTIAGTTKMLDRPYGFVATRP